MQERVSRRQHGRGFKGLRTTAQDGRSRRRKEAVRVGGAARGRHLDLAAELSGIKAPRWTAVEAAGVTAAGLRWTVGGAAGMAATRRRSCRLPGSSNGRGWWPWLPEWQPRETPDGRENYPMEWRSGFKVPSTDEGRHGGVWPPAPEWRPARGAALSSSCARISRVNMIATC